MAQGYNLTIKTYSLHSYEVHQVVQFCNDLAVAFFLSTKSNFDLWFLCQSLLYFYRPEKKMSENSIQLTSFSVILRNMFLLLVLIAVLEPCYLVTVCFCRQINGSAIN